MRAFELFYEFYKIENIREVYAERIKNNSSPGLDRINRRLFESELDKNLNIISRKVINGTYKFTRYKQKLLSKGEGKNPRVISIPTIRDKITLAIMKNILAEIYKNEVSYSVIHRIINLIVETLQNEPYDHYFKIDLSQFYDTIDHQILLSKVKSKIRKKAFIQLVERAIKTPTVEESYSKGLKIISGKGVPQGLSISNILAGLYLSKFDKKHNNQNHYKYFRFVDDILILCHKEDFIRLKKAVEQELEKKYLLQINKEKTENGKVQKNEISYLGYLVSKDQITVRPSSVKKLELSLEKLFKEYAIYKKISKELFIWKLNIKITGLIKDNKKRGWTFFFSQITNERILFHFDWLIKQYIKRFNLEGEVTKIKIKKFIRTFKEIKNNLHGTTYIPNLDEFTVEDKRSFIETVLGLLTSSYSDELVEEMFDRETYKFIRELERDLQHFS